MKQAKQVMVAITVAAMAVYADDTTRTCKAGDDCAAPVVRGAFGAVRGRRGRSPSTGEETVEFLGIPFAEPPVGVLRWRAPRPFAPWTGIIDADAAPAGCVHGADTNIPNLGDKPVSEDCLYLSVIGPRRRNKSARGLPVLAYVYGGSFAAGDTSLYTDGAGGAQNIATAGEGAIFAIMNYRLGPLGFLASKEISAETGEASMGNFGFADQRMALVWIKEHISAFGGDPDRITIAGMSAGGMSVIGHTTSKLTPPGLFSAACSQSGSANLAGFTQLEEATDNGAAFLSCARKYAAARGRPCRDDMSDVACARVLSGDEVDFLSNPTGSGFTTKLIKDLCGDALKARPGGSYHPTVDGVEWTDYPLVMAQRGEISIDATLLIGDVANEANMFTYQFIPEADKVPAAAMDAFLAAVPSIANKKLDVGNAKRALASYNPKHFAGMTHPVWRSLAAVVTDALFVCSNREFATAFAAAKRPVYNYLFTEMPQCWTPTSMYGYYPDVFRVFHECDVVYFFDSSRLMAFSERTYGYGFVGANRTCSPGTPPLNPPFDEALLNNSDTVTDPKLVDPKVIQSCGRAGPIENFTCPLDPSTRDAYFGYLTSFLATGEPGDAYGKAPNWPRFEPATMKRALIGNATRIEPFASEACDLWKEVDITKLYDLMQAKMPLGKEITGAIKSLAKHH